jgi:hypothetical protein
MITVLILIALIALGAYTMNRLSDHYSLFGFEMASLIVVISCSAYLIIHLVLLFIAPYEYNDFKARRDSFEITLKDSRNNMTEFERAAILKEISYMNMTLASKKYYNTTFFGQYVDDRFDSLEPIK